MRDRRGAAVVTEWWIAFSAFCLLRIMWLANDLVNAFHKARVSHEASQIAIHKMLVKIYEEQSGHRPARPPTQLPPDVERARDEWRMPQ